MSSQAWNPHHDVTSDHGEVHAHVSSVALNLKVFAVLVLLTLLTVAAYQIRLGAMNLVVAIIIATIKATLVVFYFMHMKYEARFNVLVFVGALLFGGVFLAYTINDTEYRGKVDPFNGGRVDPATGNRAYGSPPIPEAQ